MKHISFVLNKDQIQLATISGLWYWKDQIMDHNTFVNHQDVKYVWMYWSFFANSCLGCCQLYSCQFTIYKSRTQHNTTLLKGFCFTPLNLNLFSNSSFYLKGSSSYLHIYNSLQPTSCPALYCNLQIGYF